MPYFGNNVFYYIDIVLDGYKIVYEGIDENDSYAILYLDDGRIVFYNKCDVTTGTYQINVTEVD
jgi:hypothetical protein